MLTEDWARCERLLASLIARAYAADHPELFRRPTTPDKRTEKSGSPAASAEVAGALPANAGGPDEESREHDRTTEHDES